MSGVAWPIVALLCAVLGVLIGMVIGRSEPTRIP